MIQRNIVREEILQQQEYMVGEVANGIYAEIQKLGQKAIDMASLPISKAMLHNPPPLGYVQEVYRQLPGYDEFLETINGFVDEDASLAYLISGETGALLLNTWIQIPEDYDGRDNDYYSGPVETEGLFITEPYLNPEGVEGTDPTAITISYPVMERGKILGVSGIDIGLGGISGYVGEMAKKYNASIGLFTKKGSVIYDRSITDTSRIYNFSTLLEMLGAENIEEVEKVLYGGKTDRVMLKAEQDLYAVTTPVPGTDWMVSVFFPVTDISDRIIRSILPVTVLSLIILLATLGAVAFILNITVIKSILATSNSPGACGQGRPDAPGGRETDGEKGRDRNTEPVPFRHDGESPGYRRESHRRRHLYRIGQQAGKRFEPDALQRRLGAGGQRGRGLQFHGGDELQYQPECGKL